MAADDPAVAAAVKRAKKLLHRRALAAAAASVVPIPGLDWAVDAALLSRVIPQISAEFGLSAEQIDQLDPKKREQVQKAVGLVGSVLIGKMITREVVIRLTQSWQAKPWRQPLVTPRCATLASSICATACVWSKMPTYACHRPIKNMKLLKNRRLFHPKTALRGAPLFKPAN